MDYEELYGTEFEKSECDKVKEVYCMFICVNCPEETGTLRLQEVLLSPDRAEEERYKYTA